MPSHYTLAMCIALTFASSALAQEVEPPDAPGPAAPNIMSPGSVDPANGTYQRSVAIEVQPWPRDAIMTTAAAGAPSPRASPPTSTATASPTSGPLMVVKRWTRSLDPEPLLLGPWEPQLGLRTGFWRHSRDAQNELL